MFPAFIKRGLFLEKARSFFQKKHILETDVCALSPFAAIALNIDVVEAFVTERELGYLHTSPEYAMKRLLAEGSGDIYYLGHVFRKGEIGRYHNPEFTMAEWYRVGMSFSQMIEEACEFLFLFFSQLPVKILSYREAFSQFLGIDYTRVSMDELRKLTREFLPNDATGWDRMSYLHLLLTHFIEPHLGREELTALIDYPPSEAALACTREVNGERVAERFEIYYRGVELANGYHELGNGREMRARFEEQNGERKKLGKTAYVLDEKFLQALDLLPPCCGVSVGFDRALMLSLGCAHISEVLPFTWQTLST